MPEQIRKNIDEYSLYATWHITESDEELYSAITLREDEETLYRTFVAVSRKKQWLAYRLLIRELLKPFDFPVEYDQTGKPYLAGSDFHISVSHTADLAAVILSRKGLVGIDIEKVNPRILKVKDKFLHEAELLSINKADELEQLTLAWCAKEALYKLFGMKYLDFREHISLDIPSGAGTFFKGIIRFDGRQKEYRLISEKIGSMILVYAIDPLI